MYILDFQKEDGTTIRISVHDHVFNKVPSMGTIFVEFCYKYVTCNYKYTLKFTCSLKADICFLVFPMRNVLAQLPSTRSP